MENKNDQGGSPKISNPKPEGQKHYENTSEMSKPHTSTGHPEEHVDALHFGEGGKPAHEHDVDGITDKNSIDMGKQTYEQHQSNKKS